MTVAPAVSFFEVALAIHIMAVVVAFGATFALPIIFAVGSRLDPRSLPVLHRIECAIDQRLVNPGLLLVILAGIYLASKLHAWSYFFVQWGLGVAIVIGGLVGSVMIPTAKRAADLAERDVNSSGEGQEIVLSEEYRALTRRLAGVGSLLSLLVLITIFFMVTQFGT
jgi:hypothetical protein